MKFRPIRQQRIVILGASSGIGRQTAFEFCQQGVDYMVVSARSQIGIESLVQELRQINPLGNYFGFLCDCSQTDSVRQLVAFAMENMGRIDTWVQVAGITQFSTFMDTTEEEFQRILDVNVIGSCRAAWSVIPVMKQQYLDAKIKKEPLYKSTLIFMGSVEGKRALPYQSAYSASKHAVDGMVEALRMEMKKENAPIQISQILPSNIDTPFYDNARCKVKDSDNREYVALPPTYTPALVASGVVYAATHGVRDLTIGDGGYFAQWAQAFVPRLVDTACIWFGFALERSARKKPNEDNLFKPLDKYNQTRGNWGSKPLPFSLYNFIRQKIPF